MVNSEYISELKDKKDDCELNFFSLQFIQCKLFNIYFSEDISVFCNCIVPKKISLPLPQGLWFGTLSPPLWKFHLSLTLSFKNFAYPIPLRISNNLHPCFIKCMHGIPSLQNLNCHSQTSNFSVQDWTL